jgi:hypothetical protein
MIPNCKLLPIYSLTQASIWSHNVYNWLYNNLWGKNTTIYNKKYLGKIIYYYPSSRSGNSLAFYGTWGFIGVFTKSVDGGDSLQIWRITGMTAEEAYKKMLQRASDLDELFGTV